MVFTIKQSLFSLPITAWLFLGGKQQSTRVAFECLPTLTAILDGKIEVKDTLTAHQQHLKALAKSRIVSNIFTRNPDSIVDAYGADTLRLYEMFMGPLEQTKPWNMELRDRLIRIRRKLRESE